MCPFTIENVDESELSTAYSIAKTQVFFATTIDGKNVRLHYAYE